MRSVIEALIGHPDPPKSHRRKLIGINSRAANNVPYGLPTEPSIGISRRFALDQDALIPANTDDIEASIGLLGELAT
jgi:hypothetical protein